MNRSEKKGNLPMQTYKDTFDLWELFLQIKKYLWLLILSMLIFGGAGWGISKYVLHPEYESSVMMIVNTRVDQNQLVTNDNITSAQNLVATYSIIIKSNTVLEQVIEDLDLKMSYGTLNRNVSVSAVDNTQVMRIAVRSDSKNQARAIVQSISEIAPDIIVDNVEAGSCKVISHVISSDQPVSPNVLKNTILMATLGAMIAIISIVGLTLFKIKRIVDEVDVQNYTNLPVLGVIPEIEGDNR